MPSRRSSKPVAERFWAKVAQGEGCWEWQASRAWNGYGTFMIARADSALAHRMSWKLTHGPIPEGMQVLHKCDNRACVRPEHLWLGTQSDNMRDMHAKGRGRTGPKRRPRCGRGHAPNWYTNPNTGRRRCRACLREWQRARRDKKEA